MPCPHFLKWGNQGVERQLGFLCVTFLHALVSSSVKWARGGGVRDYLDCGYDVFTKGLAVLDEATVGKWGGGCQWGWPSSSTHVWSATFDMVRGLSFPTCRMGMRGTPASEAVPRVVRGLRCEGGEQCLGGSKRSARTSPSWCSPSGAGGWPGETTGPSASHFCPP